VDGEAEADVEGEVISPQIFADERRSAELAANQREERELIDPVGLIPGIECPTMSKRLLELA